MAEALAEHEGGAACPSWSATFLKDSPRLLQMLTSIGCALTCAALLGAFRSSYRGDSTTMNRMLRGRIYAQGFTLVALVAGSMYYETDRAKRKQFEGRVKEKKLQDKNQAWIRELEARDEEEKMMKERRRRMLEQAEGEGQGEGMRRDDGRMGDRVGGVLEAVKNLGGK